MKLWGTGEVYTVATGQHSTTTPRADNFRPLPPGIIPGPRRAHASESLPQGRPSSSRRNVIVAGIAVVAAGAAATALLGHSAPAPDAPALSVTVQRSAPDAGYLTTVHQQADFATTGDDLLIKTGHLLCDKLRSGVSPDQIGLVSTGKPYTVEDVSTALGAAAGAYCPDQMARVGIIE